MLVNRSNPMSFLLVLMIAIAFSLAGCSHSQFGRDPKSTQQKDKDQGAEEDSLQLQIEGQRNGSKLTPFESKGRYGYKNAQGEVVIPARYKMAQEFSSHGIAAVLDDKGWIYIDQEGKNLIRPFFFDNGPDYFVEGLARYEYQGKMGFIDEAGTIIIPAQFDFVGAFQKGVAIFCQNCTRKQIHGGDDEHSEFVGGRWGLVNREGKIILPAQFDKISNVQGNLVTVEKGGKRHVLQFSRDLSQNPEELEDGEAEAEIEIE